MPPSSARPKSPALPPLEHDSESESRGRSTIRVKEKATFGKGLVCHFSQVGIAHFRVSRLLLQDHKRKREKEPKGKKEAMESPLKKERKGKSGEGSKSKESKAKVLKKNWADDLEVSGQGEDDSHGSDPDAEGPDRPVKKGTNIKNDKTLKSDGKRPSEPKPKQRLRGPKKKLPVGTGADASPDAASLPASEASACFVLDLSGRCLLDCLVLELVHVAARLFLDSLPLTGGRRDAC